MKIKAIVIGMLMTASSATAQQMASAEDYRVCPPSQTQTGLETVRQQCGSLSAPDMKVDGIASLDQIASLSTKKDSFQSEVSAYGACVTSFINSYRRPGADANSTAPDEAACAHAWAEDQLTKANREFMFTCIAYQDQAAIKGEPEFQGSCYPYSSETREG